MCSVVSVINRCIWHPFTSILVIIEPKHGIQTFHTGGVQEMGLLKLKQVILRQWRWQRFGLQHRRL